MTVVAMVFAFFATPAHSTDIASQGTTENFNWVIDDDGVVYLYPKDYTTDELITDYNAGDLTYTLYTCGSLQVVYISTACSTGSITNTASMFESTALSGGNGIINDGVYGDVARASIDSDDASDCVVVEDIETVHAPGWAYEDGAYRYYEPDGTMRANAWVAADGAWYYLGSDGAPVMGQWVNDGGYDYYLGADGKLVTNDCVYDGGLYWFLDSDGRCVTSSTSSVSGSLAAVTNACYSTPSTGSGGCAAWVSNVFANAGIGSWHGNACDFYWSYCTSTDLSELQPGMIIAVSSCAGTSASIAYGHVGIYLGNGVVMQNLLGSVGTMSLDTWLSYFDGYSTPAWGWLGGVVLY